MADYHGLLSADLLKAARAYAGITQDTLAESAGVSVPLIALMEQGNASPKLKTVKAVRGALEEMGFKFLKKPEEESLTFDLRRGIG